MNEPTRRADESFREIERRLRPFLARRVGSSVDVDDVLQEVFLRLSRGLGSLRDEERLSAWLFAIARRAVADHHRDRARHPIGEESAIATGEPEPDDASETVEDEMLGCVAGFVARLPDDFREAITLVEIEGVSQKRAAAMLGLSPSGMKSRVQRGRAALRRMFETACALELDARQKVIDCEPKSSCRSTSHACSTEGRPRATR